MRLPSVAPGAVDLQSIRNSRDTPSAPIYVPQSAQELFEWMKGRLDTLALDFNRRIKLFPIPFTVGAGQVVILRPEEQRQYFFIQNTHATQVLYVGFGYAPNAANGMQIGPQGFYEPYWVPQNEIQILGSAAATTGVLLYAANIERDK